jgi:hypothetical protein
MHTINSYPAIYEKGRQIVYANLYGDKTTIKLVPTLKQIKKEQKMSWEWRVKESFASTYDDNGYGFIKVRIPKNAQDNI